tara:strand:+ start:890 stop:1183 length:294 start_codon:yes stop_codon:yes gene_type:complete
MLRRILSLVLNYDQRYRTRTTKRLVERRVPRYESSWETSDRTVEEWSEESLSELDSSSYVQRLEDEERDRRSRTTRLSEQHEGMGRKCEEIPDPWLN